MKSIVPVCVRARVCLCAQNRRAKPLHGEREMKER